MNVTSDISNVLSRIQAIQSRIADISGTPPTPAPVFGDVLDAARGNVPGVTAKPMGLGGVVSPALPSNLRDPDGGAVRPIPLNDGTGYASYIQRSAAKYGVDPGLVKAVIQAESSGNPYAVSRAGAQGLMQLMPANSREAGVTDPFDPEQNIDAGTQQLSNLLTKYGGNLDDALAAYNAGPGAVSKYGGVPPYRETQDYIKKIRRMMESK